MCKKRGILIQGTGGVWITKPFNNWKNAIEKMRAHARSDIHNQSYEVILSINLVNLVNQSCQSILSIL